MKKIILVTGATKECGIYQYADSVYEILKTSKNYEFEFLATDSYREFNDRVSVVDPYAIIYNHHPSTLNWLNNGITRPIANLTKTKQLAIVGHEHVNKFTGINSYIFTDPRKETSGDEYAGVPPISYYDDIQYSKPNNVLKIGTSGISNVTKNLEQIIGLINEQFSEDVILNLHLANGAYVDPSGGLSNSLEQACRKLAKSNVQINVTQEFFNKKDLITWLNQNDINLYWYRTPNVPGVSGSVDRALASKKPFGVNDSTFLSHTRRDFNDLTKTSIKDIVAGGIEPFQEFYDAWNPNKLLTLYEGLLDK